MSDPSTPLNDREIRQALTVLGRELVSPANERLFRWLNWSVWSTLGCAVLWLLVLFQLNEELQQIPLLLALLSFTAAVILFFLNLTLLTKYWRAVRMERRLGISRRVTRLTATVMSRAGWQSWLFALTWFLIFLPLGLLLVWFGGRAVWAAVSGVSPGVLRLSARIGYLIFGLSCLALYPLSRCKARLDAISRLRTTLVGGPDLSHEQRNLLTTIERTRILVDRKHGAAARQSGTQHTIRMTRAFRASLSAIPPDEIGRVYGALRLLLEQIDRRAPSSSDEASRFRVPDTSLEIDFTRNRATREVFANALYRSGKPLPAENEAS